MFKKSHIKILADKPELFRSASGDGLDEDSIQAMRAIPRLAVADISAFTDFSLLYGALAELRPDALLPAVDYKGTEFGDWQSVWQRIVKLKAEAEKKLHVYVLDPVLIGAPRFWRALATDHSMRIKRRFGLSGPCNGCMLYSFAIRIPLCKHVHARDIITDKGAPVSGQCEYVDCDVAMRYAAMLLSNFGITLMRTSGTPIAHSQEAFDAGCAAMECILARAHDSRKAPPQMSAYYELFAVPAVAKIVSRILAGGTIDYTEMVGQTLE